jgi:hypothetical protein
MRYEAALFRTGHMRINRLERYECIAALGSTAVAWPVAATIVGDRGFSGRIYGQQAHLTLAFREALNEAGSVLGKRSSATNWIG